MKIIVDIPNSLYANLGKIQNGSIAAKRIIDHVRQGQKIDLYEIKETLKEIANGDTIDVLVEVMRILEGGKHGETDNDSGLPGRDGTLPDE